MSSVLLFAEIIFLHGNETDQPLRLVGSESDHKSEQASFPDFTAVMLRGPRELLIV